jgi:uncharacterized protein (DUF1330 family)
VPKGYVIFNETINDQAAYDAYVQKAVPTVMQSGGRAIVFQNDPETLEGTWPGKCVVVLEFASVDAARAWYDSSDYQAVIGERHAAADCSAVILPGLE